MTTTIGSERLRMLFCFAIAGFICEVPWATAGFLFFAFLLALLLTDDLSSSEGVDCLWVPRVDFFALPNTNIAPADSTWELFLFMTLPLSLWPISADLQWTRAIWT
jgi:hypothetical protein